MKNKFYIIYLICSTIIFVQCNKDINTRTSDLLPLIPINEDKDAGIWKTILIGKPDSIAISTPIAINNPIYVGELNEIKGLQKNATEEQRANMRYWAAGGVLRWNEIMRSLVAKYNLPPFQNADETYPIPSSANPFAYPLFPFANPPYSARAFAYISAAQYDAMVACWNYKNVYKRAMPYNIDSNIQALQYKSNFYSYPSESAVLAGVTAEMMKLLFPTEIAYIEQLAILQENAAKLAGNATTSDIKAGEELGRKIALLFVNRARTDNAGKAVGTPTDWANLATKTMQKGEIPWISLESPQRPPMLPFFGNVTPFLFDTLQAKNLVPPPPPSTNSDSMKQELNIVYNTLNNYTNDNQRTVLFWGDGIGTYTPPGHWNSIAADDFILKQYSEVRWARNFALLNMALMDAAIVCWKTKYTYFNPRPTQLNPDIKTLTGIPNFPSYISGHSTFSGAAATILGFLIPENKQKYIQLANDASLSRLLGGIHYKIDCEVGLQVGNKIGQFAINKASVDGANK